jgi:hypothetical protein
LSGPGYSLDNRVRVQLESKKDMKKRQLDSPDDADALALTFAQTVAVPQPKLTPEIQYFEIDRSGNGWLLN